MNRTQYHKIFLLLPFLSNAMIQETKHTDEQDVAISRAALPESQCMSFELFGDIGDFVGISRPQVFFPIMFTNFYNFLHIYNHFQHSLNQFRITSNKACEETIILSRFLKILHRRNLLPSRIFIPMQLPASIKNKFKIFLEETKNYATLSFDKGRMILSSETFETEKGIIKRILTKTIADTNYPDLLEFKYVQEILKNNVKFLNNLDEDKILEEIEDFVSGFEDVTKIKLSENSKENRKFVEQLTKRIQNKICFIVKNGDTANFIKLCGDAIARMDVLLIVEKEFLIKPMLLYPAALNVYTFTPVTINDINLQNFQFINWPNLQLDSLLEGCCNLKKIDLSPLSQVTRIGFGFLSKCSGLVNLDLNPLSKVKNIGSEFLAGCSGLTSLDFSSMNQVTNIELCFLQNCSSLTNIDFSSMNQVMWIGENFLYGCNKLTHLNLSAFKNVIIVGRHFLHHCAGLERKKIITKKLPKNHSIVRALDRHYSCCDLS